LQIVCTNPFHTLRSIAMDLTLHRSDERIFFWGIANILLILGHRHISQRSGAVGACRAHNPEVVGSKPTFATGDVGAMHLRFFLMKVLFFALSPFKMDISDADNV
jgi:hypothetical protein